MPQPADSEIDLNSTTFLSHIVRRWGKTGLSFLNGWDLRQHRYGFIGLEDWSMYPVLRPGSLVLIDESGGELPPMVGQARWTVRSIS